MTKKTQTVRIAARRPHGDQHGVDVASVPSTGTATTRSSPEPSGSSSEVAQRCSNNGTLPLFGSNYQDVFAFLVLVLVLIFRPTGLVGERVAERA